ncbi:MAG: T9SS type A sorting domain-containing protein [Bacteroidetes bacterium]|nr:T9SS type A sorting domain-containing protein [Bacteroidota bacterium]
MKTLFIALCAIIFSISVVIAQSTPPDFEWKYCIGGTLKDNAQDLVQTSDGGYLIVGHTESNDVDATGNHGGGDGWIVKVNSQGEIQWHRCYGGKKSDVLSSIVKLSNGNYLLCGQTSSLNGDVVGNHGENDIWILVINDLGDILWQRCLGGTNIDRGSYAFETSDHCYMVSGQSYSLDGDVSGNMHGRGDIWIVKMDTLGNIIWQKLYGGTGLDFAYGMRQTLDGGYIVISYTTSTNGDIIGNHGSGEGFVQKLDASGNVQWSRCIGGTSDDYLHCVRQLPSGEYVICGRSLSNNGDVLYHHGSTTSKDWLFLKLDQAGNIIWQKSFGGTIDECSYYFSCTQDGGFVITGHTYSNDGDVSGNHNTGEADYWVVKTDQYGNIQWQKCLGGKGNFGDNAVAVIQSEDGGYVVAGSSDSRSDDVTGLHGREDLWLVKLEAQPIPSNTISAGVLSDISYLGGDSITVPFYTTGLFDSTNVFTAQLSDGLGSFNVPQTLGSASGANATMVKGVIPIYAPPGSMYRVRIISSTPADTGSSTMSNINISMSPAACTVPDSLAAFSIAADNSFISWKPVPIAQSYKVRYKISGNNPWMNLSVTTPSAQLTNLQPSTTYVWNVKTVCQSAPLIASDWSPQQTFGTPQLRGVLDKPFSFEAAPNPATNETVIEWNQTQDGKINIELFNLLNQKLTNVAQGYFDEGSHRVNLNLGNYPDGVYFLRMTVGEKEFVKKLVKE